MARVVRKMTKSATSRADPGKPEKQPTDQLTKQLTKEELTARLGVLLKNLPNQNELEQPQGMNLHTNTLFQKMISADVWKKGCKIRPDDYYTGMVFIDYLATYLTGEMNLCDNLAEISSTAKREMNDSYLPLEVVVLEAGLYAKEKPDDYFSSKNLAEMKKRYDSQNTHVDFSSDKLRKPEPYYDALGVMVSDLVKPDYHRYMAKVTGRGELKAVIFTASILNYMKDSASRKKVKDYLDKEDYFSASAAALDSFRKEVNLSDIQKYFMKALFPDKADAADSKSLGDNPDKDEHDKTDEILGVHDPK